MNIWAQFLFRSMNYVTIRGEGVEEYLPKFHFIMTCVNGDTVIMLMD